MIYRPDDKPIVNPMVKALNDTMQKRYKRTTLEAPPEEVLLHQLLGTPALRRPLTIRQSLQKRRSRGCIGNIHGGHLGGISSRRLGK